MKDGQINVVGAGLAGCEAAYQLAKRGYVVNLYDIKPQQKTPAHSSDFLCELVCSNSLKNNLTTNACGLLKAELRMLDSLVIAVADTTSVPAGNALAVNRDDFAKGVTDKILGNSNINFITKEVIEIDNTIPTIIATGPLTTDTLSEKIKDICDGNLAFYDAAAPIIDKESVDMEYAFFGDRYKDGVGDYLNCPMDKEEYDKFYNELINAKTVILKDFEKKELFEGCMPVEEMARKGYDTLRYGMLKPVGLRHPVTLVKHHAVLQLRKEDVNGMLYNMVGFQTNLNFPEQKRVFSLIPALKNASFVKYGVMHRNTYVNASLCLDNAIKHKTMENLYFAGQITGVEGYVESVMSGLVAALYVNSILTNTAVVDFTSKTMMGSILQYLTIKNEKLQPMNANFGIIEPMETNIRDKVKKYTALAERALITLGCVIEKYKI